MDALEALEQEATSVLNERTRTALLTEIGIGFHALLCEHLKKYTVSATGGLMLTKDLAMYQDVCSRFHIPLVQDRFEMLRQLGTLFIVQPSVLKSYMREGHLSSVDESLLQPYLSRREDYAREIRGMDESQSTGVSEEGGAPSSLLSPLIPQSLGSASPQAGKESRELRAFVTDMPDIPAIIESLLHPQTQGPSSGTSTPTRSTTPVSSAHAHADSPMHASPGKDTAQFTSSPVKPPRHNPALALHHRMQELDLS